MNILIIGAGNMGVAYARSIATAPLLEGRKIKIVDRNAYKIKALREEGLFDAFDRLEDCLPTADIVFMAVKPQQAPALFRQMKTSLNSRQLFVSIMAGVQLRSILKALQIQKVVRAMPNLPAQIGKGMTVFTATEAVSRQELKLIQDFLDRTGKAIYVKNEKLTDAATAISGSGPAYVFFFMETLIQAARQLGFSTEEAETLVITTFSGAVQVFQQSDSSLKEWIEKISSTGGTTEAALHFYQKENVRDLIKNGVFRAWQRAIELGK